MTPVLRLPMPLVYIYAIVCVCNISRGVIYDIQKDTGETKQKFEKEKHKHTHECVGYETRNGANERHSNAVMQQSLKLWYEHSYI